MEQLVLLIYVLENEVPVPVLIYLQQKKSITHQMHENKISKYNKRFQIHSLRARQNKTSPNPNTFSEAGKGQ